MKKVNDFEGITENLLAFKKEVADAGKITFAGVPGVCTPFAELFAYVIRDKESVFITRTGIESARKIEMTPQGMQLSGSADPCCDVVALLGGLTTPKAEVKIEDVKDMVKKILKKEGKLLGLCYMDMFREAGWEKELDFDCIINGTLTGFILKK